MLCQMPKGDNDIDIFSPQIRGDYLNAVLFMGLF